jgi:phosphoserine phosphatase
MNRDNEDNRPVLVCDLDGTLIKEDLEKCFMAYLIRTKTLKMRALALGLILTPVNLVCKWIERGSIWKVWLTGLTDEETEECFNAFFSTWSYSICEPVLRRVRGFFGRKILLTGSFERLAVRWLERSNLRSAFDEVIGCRVYPNSIRVERHPYGRSKLVCLGNIRPSVSLGNEYADRHVLGISSTAVCVGGDPKLASALETHPDRVIV